MMGQVEKKELVLRCPECGNRITLTYNWDTRLPDVKVHATCDGKEWYQDTHEPAEMDSFFQD